MARLLAAATASLLLLGVTGAQAQPSAQKPTSAELQLVEAYAPHTMLREQTDEENCHTSEEQYSPPTTVDTVLGNPSVVLKHDDGKNYVSVKRAPTAAEIARLGDTYYLDLAGDPLEVKCPEVGSYAKDFATLRGAGGAPAITYAHIAREEGHPGFAVQYWFFYYFNQFNDVHEGDWEGMQIAFDADTPEAALAQGPSQIALFQHAGGERADWGDEKVQKDGTHPIVYPAAGSHATFYDDAIYIQNGQNGSGVGCDNTSSPSVEADPRPEIIPTDAPPGTKYQWLSFLGHWGEKESGFNNGPQGPVTKSQWLEPFTWMDGIRQDSPRLPGGTILGPTAATAFCGAVASVSEFINLKAKTTTGAFGLGAALLLLILIPIFVTRWRPVDLSELRHRWAAGQLLRGARQLYGRHWRTMLLFALAGFVVLGAIQGFTYLFSQLNNGSRDFTLSISPGDLELKLGGSFDGIADPIGSAIAGGLVVAFMRQLANGEDHGFRHCWSAMSERLWRVVAGQLLALALVYLLVATLIGIPVAAYMYIAWQFIQQEILFENRSIREAFRGSRRMVRGRWWRTLRVAAILLLISVAVGPIFGFFLIFLNFSPVVVNVVGSVLYALLIPYVAIGRTLLYFDLQANEKQEREAGLVRPHWYSRAQPASQSG